MYIYQLNRIVFRGVEEIEYSRSSTAEYRTRLDKNIEFLSTYRGEEPVEVELTGVLTAYNGLSVQQQYNRLLSLIGQPGIDLVGFQQSPDRCKTRWFTNYGTVTEVSSTRSIDAYLNKEMEVSVSVLINPYWNAMHPLLWACYPVYHIPDPFSTADVEGFNYPQQIQFNGDPIYWFYRSKVITEDDLIHAYGRHAALAYFIPETTHKPFFAQNFAISGGGVNAVNYNLYMDEEIYNAPPLSLMRFSDVEGKTGELNIKVTYEINMSSQHILESRLNLTAFSDLLNSPIFPSGVTGTTVYVGNLVYGPSWCARETASSFIVRSSASNAILTPSWEFNGRIPFETPGLFNRVEISTDCPDQLSVSVAHLYRGY